MAEELVIKLDTSSDGNIGKLDKTLDSVAKSATKADNALADLRKEIKSAKSDMLKYEEGTVEYSRALNRAAAAQTRFKEQNDILKASSRDFGQVMKNVGNAVGGVVGGFQVAQGVMALFGSESEASLKTIQNITAAMSVTQGIVGFANGIDDIKDLFAGFRAQSLGAAEGVENLVQKNAMLASNIAQTGTIVSQSASIDSAATATKSANLIKFQEQQVRYNAALADLKAQERLLQEQGLQAEVEINRKKQAMFVQGLERSGKQIAAIEATTVATKGQAAATETLGKTTEKTSNTMTKSLVTMGLWLGAIIAVTYGITKLIEWLNKIPEDVKIKVDLETESLNKLKGDQDKIRQFALDYNKASREGNNERITELEKYAKKEYDLNGERLKAIKTNVNGWREAFKDYLKIAEDTYYNEALSKKRTEAEINLQIAKQQKDIFGEIIKDEKTPIGRQSVKELIDKGKMTVAFGAAQEYKDAVQSIKTSQEEIKALNKIAYRDVDMGTGKPTGGGGTSTTTTKKSLSLDTKQLAKPTLTEGENFYKPIIDSTIKYTAEEQLILEDSKKNRENWYYDTVMSQIQFAIDLESARKIDLQNSLNYQYEQKALLEDSLKDFDDKKAAYDIEIANLNDYEKNKSNYQNLITAAQDEFTALGDKATAKDKKRIEEKIKFYQDEISAIDSNMEAKKKEIATLTEQLKLYDEYPDKIKQITEQIASLNVQIADSTRTSVELERDAWAERLQNFKGYVDALGTVNSALTQMGEDQMEIIDNKTNKEKNDLELSQKYRESDSESQQKMMYDLELANYEQKKGIFEANKKFQIAGAIISGISGELDAISNFLKNGGFLNPLAIASLAAETIAITTGTIMTVKKIQSTSLDKPVPPSSGVGIGSGGSGVNVALNPSKDALTTKEENLNTMSKSNMKDIPTSVVRVTEINDVQQKVKVRESNSSF